MKALPKVWIVCRDVLLLAFVVVAAWGAAPRKDVDMPLGDVFEKLARGQTLTPMEIEELRLKMNGIESRDSVVAGWLQGGTSTPRFRSFYADQGEFGEMPGGLGTYTLYGEQAIGNNLATVIDFDRADPVRPDTDSRYFRFDETTNYFYPQLANMQHYILVTGTIQWQANATGRRAIHMNAYNSADVLQYGVTMHSISPDTTLAATIPFSTVIPIADDIYYFVFTVTQTSGGDLNVEYARVNLWIIR